MHWEHLPADEVRIRINSAIETTRRRRVTPLGVPAAVLAAELIHKSNASESPFLMALQQPSRRRGPQAASLEGAAEGVKALEREAVRICAEQLMRGSAGMQDGYVASGGTECNIQAAWVYRNYFRRKFNGAPSEIALVSSEDTHYSISKAANLLGLQHLVLPVHPRTRQISPEGLDHCLRAARGRGVRFITFVANMGTTMYGSVDKLEPLVEVFEANDMHYTVHVDGAFGGFIHPFTAPDSTLNFSHPAVTSIGLDAHKMLQLPYGTGVFLLRKEYTENGLTPLSEDHSGASAIALWVSLNRHGSAGLSSKVAALMQRTRQLVDGLEARGMAFIHEPSMNIVAIHRDHIRGETARAFGLVPDDHDKPTWWKVVLMEHVSEKSIQDFLGALCG